MTGPTVSVVIVSRDRPAHLALCLRAVLQICYHPFEVVVVADDVGLAVVERFGLTGRIKTVPFSDPNIPAARNHGIKAAGGEVIAFLDDDSVPEPGWLFHLASALERHPDADAATGFVRGRNGISFQVQAETVDGWGEVRPLELRGWEPKVFVGKPGRAISTVGTNCAFRRKVFTQVGLFDTSFRYFLDETDLNMRLARLGRKTVVVPFAQVHHRFAASDIRKESRMPLSLFNVGRSMAIYLRKHGRELDFGPAIARFVARQKNRLIAHMVAGNCEPGDVGRILGTLNDGISEGKALEIEPDVRLGAETAEFRPISEADNLGGHMVVSGYRLHASRVRRRAKEAVGRGGIVSLFLLSRTSLFHHVRFHPDGYWEQSGGVFGRSDRDNPIFQLVSLKKRVCIEVQRVAMARYPWDTDCRSNDDFE